MLTPYKNSVKINKGNNLNYILIKNKNKIN